MDCPRACAHLTSAGTYDKCIGPLAMKPSNQFVGVLRATLLLLLLMCLLAVSHKVPIASLPQTQWLSHAPYCCRYTHALPSGLCTWSSAGPSLPVCRYMHGRASLLGLCKNEWVWLIHLHVHPA